MATTASPGHLPDTLTAEQIRAGTSNRRNKVLAEHAAHILPYRGLGTGIPRALGAWPKIDLLDEREANQFRAVVWRPVVDPTSTQQVNLLPRSRLANIPFFMCGGGGEEEVLPGARDTALVDARVLMVEG